MANYLGKGFPLRPTCLPGYIRYRQTNRQTDDNHANSSIVT